VPLQSQSHIQAAFALCLKHDEDKIKKSKSMNLVQIMFEDFLASIETSDIGSEGLLLALEVFLTAKKDKDQAFSNLCKAIPDLQYIGDPANMAEFNGCIVQL
jgi:hypothetical protein